MVVVEEAEAEAETETEAEAEEGIVVSLKKTIPVSCNGHQSSAEERARERKMGDFGEKTRERKLETVSKGEHLCIFSDKRRIFFIKFFFFYRLIYE